MAKPIPHQITRGNSGYIFVEMWTVPGEPQTAGTGYLRTFDAGDWVRAACFIQELKRGKLSGKY